MQSRVTIRTLRRMARDGEAFACLTAYDATTARWLDRAGVHLLLVGDTAAETVLGQPSTIHMPLDLSITLTAAVRRGAARAYVMGDMPFMSYHLDADQAVANAGRYFTDAHADCVKLEVDGSHVGLVERMSRAGIAVCAHVGSRPQTAMLTGGYVAAGRDEASADRIVADAAALERAGAVMLLVEAVPSDVAERVVAQAGVPVIGIGAGSSPHGQILVVDDLVGLSDAQPPFAPKVAEVGRTIREAAEEWVGMVAARNHSGRRNRRNESDVDDVPSASGAR